MNNAQDHFWSNLGVVGSRLEAHFTPEQAFAWAAAPNDQLGGKAPLELVLSGQLDDVLALIDKMDRGD